MDSTILLTLLFSTLVFATPLIIGALGGLFSEKSGIVNIGIEGMMIVGAFSGATAMSFFGDLGDMSLFIGMIASMLSASLFGLLHALLCIKFKVDQIISGVSINIIAAAISMYLTKIIFLSGETPTLFTTGYTFFEGKVHIITIIAIILVFVTYYIFKKTVWGRRIIAIGENPEAGEVMGINVNKMRYQAVIISSILAGLAGLSIVLTTSSLFSGVVVSGKGFIAIAVLIFGRWNAIGVLLAAIFFGLTSSLGTISTVIFPDLMIDKVFFVILPYVLTIIFLVIFSKKSIAPKSLGKIYDKE